MAFVCPTCGNPRTNPADIEPQLRHTKADSSECYHERFGVAVPAIEVEEKKVPEGIAYLPERYPTDLRCSECSHLFREGDRYSKRFVGLTEDGTPITEVVCTDCARQPGEPHPSTH